MKIINFIKKIFVPTVDKDQQMLSKFESIKLAIQYCRNIQDLLIVKKQIKIFEKKFVDIKESKQLTSTLTKKHSSKARQLFRA
ncbi:MAG: hypothetical protein VW683_00255 [Betaproteobacteria bacterium]|jgi:DNA replicative helicase MCM subunit Mcm2 (Cdc46/Mcm family)